VCIDKELDIVFEYTAPGTPQQNGIMERAFAIMLGKTRAIMNGAGFDEKNVIYSGRKLLIQLPILKILQLGRVIHGLCTTHHIQSIYKYLDN